ncbi:MAG: hypothetical protein CMM07_08075 [Rhodopirellula sp.]|nr:hypothetical protein [Rhodopirellula sp.]
MIFHTIWCAAIIKLFLFGLATFRQFLGYCPRRNREAVRSDMAITAELRSARQFKIWNLRDSNDGSCKFVHLSVAMVCHGNGRDNTWL